MGQSWADVEKQRELGPEEHTGTYLQTCVTQQWGQAGPPAAARVSKDVATLDTLSLKRGSDAKSALYSSHAFQFSACFYS